MHWIVLWAALIAGPYSFAETESETRIEIQAVDTEHLKGFMHDAHEAFEAEDPNATGVRGFLSKWANGFNLPRMGINAFRWYQLHKDNTQLRDHAMNIAFMLSMSHSLEMASGPLGISASHYMGLPGWVDWAVGSVGAVISIPGLDPLCLGLIALYPKRQVRNTVQTVRVFVVRIVGTGARLLGFNLLMNRLFTDLSGRERLLRAVDEGKQVIPIDHSNLTFDFKTPEGKPLFTLQLDRDIDDSVALKSAHFSPEALTLSSMREIKDSLKPFGWNIRDAVLQSLTLLRKNRTDLLEHQVHIASVKPSVDDWVDVSYQPKAVSLKGRKALCSWSAWSLTKVSNPS